MTARVVKATLRHALAVARDLDPVSLAETRLHGSPRHLIRKNLAQSNEAFTLLIDGRPAAIGGWAGSRLGGTALAWLAVTPAVRARSVMFARAVLKEARRLRRNGMELRTTVAAADARAVRFAEFCGLAPDPEGQTAPGRVVYCSRERAAAQPG